MGGRVGSNRIFVPLQARSERRRLWGCPPPLHAREQLAREIVILHLRVDHVSGGPSFSPRDAGARLAVEGIFPGGVGPDALGVRHTVHLVYLLMVYRRLVKIESVQPESSKQQLEDGNEGRCPVLFARSDLHAAKSTCQPWQGPGCVDPRNANLF